MQCSYVQSHEDAVRKLANAFVRTLSWMNTHSPQQIADKMTADGPQTVTP